VEVRETLVRLFAIAAILGGAILLFGLWQYNDLGYWVGTVCGVLLIAGGVTFIWPKSWK
jgi:hypothetical protein